MALPMRKDVPVEMTWDLTLLYPDEISMQKDLDSACRMGETIISEYKGKLISAEAIVACMNDFEQMMIILDSVRNYIELASSVDFYDTHIQELSNTIDTRLSDLFSRLSFMDSEIQEADERILDAAIEQAEGSKNYLKDLRRFKPHRLSPETEKAIAAFSPIFQSPYNVYNMTKMADIRFDSFTADEKEYPLGYALFEDDYEYEENTAVRRAAFRAFSDKIRQYENTNAAIFCTNALRDKIESKLRGFDSVFDFLLFDQKVTREMYDRQLDLIMTGLAPHMRKYARLLKEAHGLEKMTYADLKLPLDPSFVPRLTLEQAKNYCVEGLSILGDDYTSLVKEAFENRWFDLANNQGKSTGGFCSTIYRKNSYILMTFNGRMSDVLTMAHELGHAGHFHLCTNAQSYFDTNVSCYLVESPSTMNELLMAHYLLKTDEDPRFKRWVRSFMVGNTYYHNFVTHYLEAWFQREVYRIIDKGGSVNAETLNKLFRETLVQFWGDDVEITEGAELTWMRQPHYYMGLYPYTYSAGLTLATEVCKRIENEGQPAVDDWKKMLTAGSTLDPIGLAKTAGIDITSDGPLLDTIAYIGELVDAL